MAESGHPAFDAVTVSCVRAMRLIQNMCTIDCSIGINRGRISRHFDKCLSEVYISNRNDAVLKQERATWPEQDARQINFDVHYSSDSVNSLRMSYRSVS